MARKHKAPVYERKRLDYTEQEKGLIHDAVTDLIITTKLNLRESAVWEVLRRYEGEMGLSPHKINYLGSAIMQALEELDG
jgi:hypothetical protein